jgi:hypothetical protein
MRPCNWNTALTEVKVLSVILQEAVRREIITANPCARLGLKRRNVKKKPEIKLEEQRVIEDKLKTAPAWMSDCWLVAMRQGMRLAEMSAVESKCITQGRIKMHHLGRRFSKWISVVVARVKWLWAARAAFFQPEAANCSP